MDFSSLRPIIVNYYMSTVLSISKLSSYFWFNTSIEFKAKNGKP